MLPLVACSQQDLGFWEGTPEKLDGCKIWAIQTNDCEFCSSYVTYTDCYGNTKEYRITDGFVPDGRVYELCSMDRPVAMNNTPPFNGIASITQTGWCTDPRGTTWNFWWDEHYSTYDDVSDIKIYSADVNGTNRNLIYSNSNPVDIIDNPVQIVDSYGGQQYYVLSVTGKKPPFTFARLTLYVLPGYSYSLQWKDDVGFITKELVFEKRSFYIGTY